MMNFDVIHLHIAFTADGNVMEIGTVLMAVTKKIVPKKYVLKGNLLVQVLIYALIHNGFVMEQMTVVIIQMNCQNYVIIAPASQIVIDVIMHNVFSGHQCVIQFRIVLMAQMNL